MNTAVGQPIIFVLDKLNEFSADYREILMKLQLQLTEPDLATQIQRALALWHWIEICYFSPKVTWETGIFFTEISSFSN